MGRGVVSRSRRPRRHDRSSSLLVTAGVALLAAACGPLSSGPEGGGPGGKADYVSRCPDSHQRVVTTPYGVNLRALGEDRRMKRDESAGLAMPGDLLLLTSAIPRKIELVDQQGEATGTYWFREAIWVPASPPEGRELGLAGEVLDGDGGEPLKLWVAAEIPGVGCGLPEDPGGQSLDGAEVADAPAPIAGHLAAGWTAFFDNDGWGDGRYAELGSAGQVLGCSGGCSFGVHRTFDVAGQVRIALQVTMEQGLPAGSDGDGAWAEVLVQRHGAGEVAVDLQRAQIVTKLVRTGATQWATLTVDGPTTVFLKVGRTPGQPVRASFTGLSVGDVYGGESFSRGAAFAVPAAERAYASGIVPSGWRLFRDSDDWAGDAGAAGRGVAIDDQGRLTVSCKRGSFGVQRWLYNPYRVAKLRVPVTVTRAPTDAACAWLAEGCDGDYRDPAPWAQVIVDGAYHRLDVTRRDVQHVDQVIGRGWHALTFKVGRIHGEGVAARVDWVGLSADL